ncbi:PRD domain-containing protein, partial [Eggerthella lenta]|nr:PRD domain-containing protein [Eggerthella lenta]
ASRELNPQDDEHDIRIFELSSRLVESFERTACVSFDDKNDLINSIYMHLKLSMYYNRLGIQVVNPLIDEIQKQYTDIYMITQL